MNTPRTSLTCRSHRPGGLAPQAGATLFEVVVVMMIVAILAAIAVPSFRNFTTSNRMTTELDALVGDMQYARSEAVRQGQSVTVCVAASVTAPYSCAAAGTDTWQNGWLVFTDLKSDQTVDTGDPVLRVQKPFTQGDTLTSDNGISSVTFNRDGFAYTGQAQVTLTLRDSAKDTGFTRCLYLSQSGMMSTAMNATDTNCQ